MARLICVIIVAMVYCIVVRIKGVQGNRSTPGYVFRHDGFVYKFVTEQDDNRTWVEARTLCREEENGELLTFGGPEQAAWVSRLIANLTREMGYLGRFWMGATDKRLRGIYEYIDNSPFKFKEAPWAKGEPNRPKGYEHNYCIVMETKGDSPEWSDEDCFQSFGYICKASDAPRRLRAVQRFGYSWEWNYYDYKFVILPDDSMTWSEAEIYCQEAESGHLLSIYNSKESEWVTDRIRQIRNVLGFRELWIGATDIFNKGNFKWTDEKPVNYTKWHNSTKTMAATKPREACVSILAHPNWGDWSDENCIKKLPFVCKTKKCQGKSDLAFIIDASGSVTESGFEKAKNFMFQVIRGFQFTDNQTNVALIGFSDQAHLSFGFNTYYKQLQIKKAIDNMPFTKGETYTDKALNLARTAVFTTKRSPLDAVPKIALLMTDGKSKEPLKTALAAKKLKEEGVTIVTLGIGDAVDRKELTRVASNYNDALYVESYAQLGAKVQDIQERVCDEIIRIGLIQEKIMAAKEKRRLALEAKQRLEAEKKRKQLEEQRKSEEARKRKLEIERKRQEARKRQEEERKRDQERKIEEARKRLAQRNRNRNQNNQRNRNMQNRYNQRNRNTQNRYNQRNRYTRNRSTPSPRNQSNRNTQNRNRNTLNRNNQNRQTQNSNHNTQNRNIQNRYNQNRNVQNRYNQRNRNTQNRNTQNRYNQNRNVQSRYNQLNRNTQNRNIQNRYNQNRNIQNRYNQRNRNILNRNTQNRNTQNRNIQSRNRYNQNRNTQNRYNQNRNTQNRYNQNRNIQNRYNQNRNIQNRHNQNRNTQNRYNQNRNTQNRYNQNRNIQSRYNQNRNTRNRYNQNRNTQNRYNQNRNTQNRYNQNRNIQNRYNQNRNTRNRNNQNRNTRNRNNQNRNIQSRYNQNRNTQNRNNQNRNIQSRYNQNRNTQNRYNRNRYNRNRYQG